MVQLDVAGAYLRWSLWRAALARGWWTATAVYLVVVAELSASQLILIGVFQGVTVVIAEIPAGVVADAAGRRPALVLSHVVMGTGMAAAGLVTAYEPLVVANCLWGLGWALSSGADVAWITDELDDPGRIDRVLAAQARWGLVGTMAGIVAAGALAAVTDLAVAMVVGGVGTVGLGAVVARWPETRPAPTDPGRPLAASLAASWAILRRGARAARADRVILVLLVATFVVNGAAVGFGRLFAQRLVALGLPDEPDPVVWFAGITLVAAGLGALSLLVVERHIDGGGVARRLYVAACLAAVVGLVGFAHAPGLAPAVAGSLLVSGFGFPMARVAETIVVNRRTSSDVRATVHSFLSQGENLGEIVLGLGLALLAGAVSSATTLTASAALLAGAAVLVRTIGD